MPRFYLLDHSLKGPGGHHFDYALHVVQAAAKLGFETVLAGNRRFRGHSDLPRNCRVFPAFRYDTYNRYTLFFSEKFRALELAREPSHAGAPSRRPTWSQLCDYVRTALREFKNRKRQNGPDDRIFEIAKGCEKVFRQVPLGLNDHVFVPTLSELDLLGFVEYMESHPRSLRATWHFQFHFNFLEGREPEFAQQQARVDEMKEPFRRALTRVPNHRVHCYNTSQELTRQYDMLDVARFENLAYPINPAFFTGRSGRVAGGPLRVTCAGGIREEKGQSGLKGIVDALWADYLAPGKIQLVVQSGRERFTGRPKFQVPVPTPDLAPPRVRLPRETCQEPVVYIRHPLGLSDYADFVGRADIGLLLYDSRRYYTRRAGVLGELLAAGIPVIVPAGCWLAEQIAEPIYRHQLKLESQLPVVGRLSPSEVSWSLSAQSDQIGSTKGSEFACGDASAAAETVLDVPVGSRELFVSFEWTSQAQPGEYVKIKAESRASDGRIIERSEVVVGQRASRAPVPALFHLPPEVASIRLSCSNAFDHHLLTLRHGSVSWLGESHGASHCPSGAVGLIASHAQQVPVLIREMCEHYDHYRASAEAFSHDWYAAHAPSRTVMQLTAATTAPQIRGAIAA